MVLVGFICATLLLCDVQQVEEYVDVAVTYDIGLSKELQQYTYEVCKEYAVDYEMVLALMGKESSYRVDAVSKTNDYGLMQINKCNHKRLGLDDPFDAKANIKAGVSMLAEANTDDIHEMLTYYNTGKKLKANSYSKDVVKRMEELKDVQCR